jgi:glycosyltransferase involved in cell wall biosynthesis
MIRALFRLPPVLRPEAAWLAVQGPYAPDLVRALARDTDRASLFMPYLYHPTIRGMPVAAHPRLLIPAAHDEPALRLRLVGRTVAAADALWYSSEEERALMESAHPIAARRPHAVGTVAIDPPAGIDGEGFRSRHSLGRYLLYAGRFTPGKGIDVLLDGYARLRRNMPDVSLALAGDISALGDCPEGTVRLGWLEETELWSAISAAEAVVVPSRLESLSLVSLEAWAMGRPCLLHAGSPVLAGQAARSGGAELFRDAAELAGAAGRLLADPAAAGRMGEAGRSHVALHYRWSAVVDRLEGLLAAASKEAMR